jgi:HK97 family phage prohead protease
MKGHVMRAQMKSAPAQIKAAGDGDGIVEALVATYAVDSGGDRIVPGAFADTLDEWAASGKTMPFIWAHQHDDIDAYLGDVLEAKEVDDGLYVKAQVDMEDPKSAKAYRLMKSGRVDNYSFAYEVKDAEPDPDDESVTLLKTIGLFEVGPVLIGMNRETRTLSVKHDGQAMSADFGTQTLVVDGTTLLKIGRVISSKNEQRLREAHVAIGDVLAQLDGDEPPSDEEGKSHTPEPSKADDRDSGKADDSMQSGPDDDLDLSLLLAKAMTHANTG